MSGNNFTYNRGLARPNPTNGQLVVDSATLITLAKANNLDLLFDAGRTVVVTSTVRSEVASNPNQYPIDQRIDTWLNLNHNRVILDVHASNPPAVLGSHNGEISIAGYVSGYGDSAGLHPLSETR